MRPCRPRLRAAAPGHRALRARSLLPSTRMPTLHLSARLVAELEAHCGASHPVEACGLLLGRTEGADDEPGRLVAHAVHPARNARKGSFTSFELAPEDFVAADSAARDADLEIIGVYHSHPGASAAPSEADRAGAQEAWLSLILAVEGAPGQGRTTSRRCFQLRGGRFEEQDIRVT